MTKKKETPKKAAPASSGKAKPKNTAKAAQAQAARIMDLARAKGKKKPLKRGLAEAQAEAKAEGQPPFVAGETGGLLQNDSFTEGFGDPVPKEEPNGLLEGEGEKNATELSLAAFIESEEPEESECSACKGLIDLSVVWHGHTATCSTLKARLLEVGDLYSIAHIANMVGSGNYFQEPNHEDQALIESLGLQFERDEDQDPAMWIVTVPDVEISDEQREREQAAFASGPVEEDELPEGVERITGDPLIDMLNASASGSAQFSEPLEEEEPAPVRASTIDGKNANVKSWIEEREVKIVYSDSDKVKSGLRLLDLMNEIEALDQKKKIEVSKIAAEKEALIGELKEIRAAARDGFEKKKVQVCVRIDVTKNAYTVTREDNGDVLQTRELNADEKQLRFNI